MNGLHSYVLTLSSLMTKSALLRTTALLLLAYAGFCLLLFVAQRRFIYFPTQSPVPLPAGFERWTAQDSNIHWGYKKIRGSQSCLFFFHGNGGNASAWSHAVDEFPGDIFVLEYPGYGGRPGHPSEASIKAAAREAFAAEHHRYTKIVVAGQSIGSAVTVAIFDTWPEKIHRLVLITPLLSVREMARAQFWFVPTRWILRDTFDLFGPWQNFSGKTHIVIAASDEIVPRSQSLRYLAITNTNVTVLDLPGTSHNSVELDANFWRETLQ